MNKLPNCLLNIIFNDMNLEAIKTVTVNKKICNILSNRVKKEKEKELKRIKDIEICIHKYKALSKISGYRCWKYYMQINVISIEDCPIIDYIISKEFTNDIFKKNIKYRFMYRAGNSNIWKEYFIKKYPGFLFSEFS